MNGEVIPPRHGFPLRILNLGHYGFKQPAWVTEIEANDRSVNYYWEDKGWDCSLPIAVDCKFFFLKKSATVHIGEGLEFGGAAYGGTCIVRVELTTDGGKT